MGKIIAVANQKGGVGKTTTSVNLSAALAVLNRRVLLVDMDPQGNATMGSGVDKYALAYGTYSVLCGGAELASCIETRPDSRLDLLPANSGLTAAEVDLIDLPDGRLRLRKALWPIRARYDYIIVDCPPSLNMLTVNAMSAADRVVIPIQCEYYALEGLSALLDTIERIRKSLNPELKIEGMLRTMFDSRNRLANEVSEQLVSHFGGRVFDTIVPRNVRLAEAPSYGLPIGLYDQASRGAEAYAALAHEIVNRGRPTGQAA